MSSDDMILELIDCESLSDWEYDFVMDISDQNYEPTEKQKEKIVQIYNKHFE